MEYRIYSLRQPPVLLHSITGGEYFSAADTDLDGRVEIWTNDAASVDGFENFHLRDLDFAPPVVLRFVRGKLLDASSEFRPYFDEKIADARAKLNPQDLRRFQKQRWQTGDGSRRSRRTAFAPAKRESEGIGNRLVLPLQRPGKGGLAFPRRDVACGGCRPDSRRALECTRARDSLPSWMACQLRFLLAVKHARRFLMGQPSCPRRQE